MTEQNERITEEEENLTQVRSIIKQLNEDKPSRERHREVVVRADGTKVVRVTKKRKVMISSHEKKRRGRKNFIFTLAGAFVVLILLIAFLFVRMASMSSSAYLESCKHELQQHWGATSVQVEGAGVDGTSFHLNNIVAEFPESCMLERVELVGVEANLDWMSFFRSKIQGTELTLQNATVVLRTGARMNMPQAQGNGLWQFSRIACKKLSVMFSEGESAPLMLKEADAYMYYPHASGVSSVVMLSSGSLHIKGWKTVNITESKFHISARGIEDFLLRGTTDTMTDIPEQRRTSIVFSGKIGPDADFAGPYSIVADNMNFADFTRGRFEEFFTARTQAAAHVKGRNLATITLAREHEEPVFNGEFHLRNICLSSFPAMMAITEHIEPAKRRFYNPVSLHRGAVKVEHEGGVMTLEMSGEAMEERDLISLRGKISLNENNELSGEISYGIPMLLARAEYPDGRPDPIFQQNGDWAILRTHLRGTGNAPADDMAEVEARAVIARRERPARIPFSEYDIDKITERMNAKPQAGDAFSSPFGTDEKQTPFLPNESMNNPFETTEDPFGNSAPF
ncbi:MAG: hypothetical protein IKY92_03890 [Akkermansia sp.]|nr:hypothetical protein [Akkermansia sp.]